MTLFPSAPSRARRTFAMIVLSTALVVPAQLAASSASAAPVGHTSVSTAASVVKAKAVTYKNCTALNKKYPHGVGKKGAKDKTTGKPVTTFKVDTAVYNANTKSDRDKDGIACEKK